MTLLLAKVLVLFNLLLRGMPYMRNHEATIGASIQFKNLLAERSWCSCVF